MTDTDAANSAFADLLVRSLEGLRLKTAAHDQLWHLGEADWAVDQDTGTMTFTRANGVTAVCPVQIIGTYNTLDGTWLWGWDHPSVEPPLQEHARHVRAYGEAHALSRLTTRKLACSEAEAWELTALACQLCDAQGAYRGPAGTVLVFMTFGTVTLSGTAQPDPPAQEPAPSTPHLESPPQGGPASLVQSFIADYAVWNDEAFRRSEGDEEMEWAIEAYAALITRYCRPGFRPQPIAFGSVPMHAPAHETIVSVTDDGTTATVATRHVKPGSGFASDYEYHFVKAGDRWYLERLLYCDEDGTYDGL